MNVMSLYSTIAPVMMVLLLAIFAAIALWAYWPGHKTRFERDGEIPFRDED